jgi:hypothetical protein
MKKKFMFFSMFVLITSILTAQNYINGKNTEPVFHPDSADFVVAGFSLLASHSTLDVELE